MPFFGDSSQAHNILLISYILVLDRKGDFLGAKMKQPPNPLGEKLESICEEHIKYTQCNLLASDSLSESRTAFWHDFGYRV